MLQRRSLESLNPRSKCGYGLRTQPYPYACTDQQCDGNGNLTKFLHWNVVGTDNCQIGYTGPGRKRIIFQMSVREREGYEFFSKWGTGTER